RSRRRGPTIACFCATARRTCPRVGRRSCCWGAKPNAGGSSRPAIMSPIICGRRMRCEDESRLNVWDVRNTRWAIDYGPTAGVNGKITVSPDGRTLLGTFPVENHEFETAVWAVAGMAARGSVCCHDVPGRGPWGYVLGIPAMLGGSWDWRRC